MLADVEIVLFESRVLGLAVSEQYGAVYLYCRCSFLFHLSASELLDMLGL